MENLEKIKQPEINAETIINVIENLKFEDYEQFEYNGTNFLLIFDKEGESPQEVDGVEYFASTKIDGFDIYLLETLPKKEQKRRLFHEILECNLLGQGLDTRTAHEIATKNEQKIFGEREK